MQPFSKSAHGVKHGVLYNGIEWIFRNGAQRFYDVTLGAAIRYGP